MKKKKKKRKGDKGGDDERRAAVGWVGLGCWLVSFWFDRQNKKKKEIKGENWMKREQ